MVTAYVQHPIGTELDFLQRCHCLEKAGFSFTKPEFHAEIALENLRAAEISEADRGTYFHISPFTTADYKELAPQQLAELITGLQKNFPEKKLALSCAPTPRELAKMEKLLPLLPQKPWRVFSGNLNLTQVAAVIKNSALHFCGDTGTLHLAVMTQTPTVAWFWPNPGIIEWVPRTKGHQTLAGQNGPDSPFLCKIENAELIQAARTALSETTTSPARLEKEL
jgi:ADP-heptose:LPS heptosyltransferase